VLEWLEQVILNLNLLEMLGRIDLNLKCSTTIAMWYGVEVTLAKDKSTAQLCTTMD
jgi:hypothetical protein